MLPIDRIQNALKAIDQASFQKLCDEYHCKILPVKEIRSVGSVPGSAKTRVGQPDTLITLTTGKFVMVEATTKDSGYQKKLADDLEECFDEEKTGVPLEQVERIILASNRQLTKEDRAPLIARGKEKGCIVEFLDLDNLSHAINQKFQPLAKEYLGIELDTGQILSPGEFVRDYQKSRFATRIDNKFLFRKSEKAEIREALKKTDLVILTGKAGVGKTKLALESAKGFVKSRRAFKPFFITNKNLHLYEDLKGYFGGDGKFLIVIDDANRLSSQLGYIFDLLKQQTVKKKLKIIVTVRDYAVEEVRRKAKVHAFSEIRVNRLSDKEITELLDEDFNIRHPDFTSRICRISEGNARLAVMAAEVVNREGTLGSISDVSQLYEQYFESITDDIIDLGGPDLIRVAGIISYFRVLDRTNTDVFEKVAVSFGLTPNELWYRLEKLHELEVVDIDYEIAKVSDQILATYLFYRAFFKDEVADFAVLLSETLDKFLFRLTDSLYPAWEAFDSEFIRMKLKPHVLRKWSELKNDESKALDLIGRFHFVAETEFLSHLKKKIESHPQVVANGSELNFTTKSYQAVSDPYLRVLRKIESDNISIVLDLIFRRLESNLELLPEVISVLNEDFCFDHLAHRWNYFIQQNVLAKVIERSRDGKAEMYSSLYQGLLLAIATKYLQMVFRTNSSRGLNVTIYTTPLRPVPALIEIRSKLWNRLIELAEADIHRAAFLKILRNHNRGWYKDTIVKGVVEIDAAVLIPFFKTLDPQRYENCLVVNRYCDYLESVDVEFDKSLRKRFTNATYEVSEILLANERRELGLEWDEYQNYKNDLLKNHFASYELADYSQLLEQCEEIQRNEENEHPHALHDSLTQILINLSQRDPLLFFNVLGIIFQSGNRLGLLGDFIIHKIIEMKDDLEETYQFISKNNFILRNSWLFAFLRQVPSTRITANLVRELYELYETAPLEQVPQSFDHLLNYQPSDSEIILSVAKRLFARVSRGDGSYSFRYLISHGEVSKSLGQIFRSDLPLLKAIYLYQCEREIYSDFKNEALQKIIDTDANFLFEYVDFLLSKKDAHQMLTDGSTDYAFLWLREDYAILSNKLLDYIYEKEKSVRYPWKPSFLELFFRDLRLAEEDSNPELKKRNKKLRKRALSVLKKALRKAVGNPDKASYVFQMISNNFASNRKEFVEVFLEQNKNLEDFKDLDFETNHIVMEDMATQIPRLEARIAFYESLLPLVSSLEFIDHRVELEKRIATLREDIEAQKRRDFIGYH